MDSSTTREIKPLPDECPTPASGRCSFIPFWEGVEVRKAGRLPPATWIRPEELPHYRSEFCAPSTLGWRFQDDLARTEGYA